MSLSGQPQGGRRGPAPAGGAVPTVTHGLLAARAASESAGRAPDVTSLRSDSEAQRPSRQARDRHRPAPRPASRRVTVGQGGRDADST